MGSKTDNRALALMELTALRHEAAKLDPGENFFERMMAEDRIERKVVEINLRDSTFDWK